MWRRVAILFSVILFVLLSGGCSDDEKISKIGISIPAADHGWTGGVVWWAEQAKKAIESKNPHIKVIVSTAKDASEQNDKVENMLAQNIKALVILPHEPAPLTGICEQAKKQGVYLVTVDRGLARPVDDLVISGDNEGFGREAAKAMAKKLGGKGDVVIMEGIPCVVNSDRVNAFRQVIAKYPNIRILASQSANWDTEKGLKLMENHLQKFPKIDAVWTGDDDVLLGALKAYEESKRRDIKFFIGGAGNKRIVKMVLDKNPLVPFDVTYPPRMIFVGAKQAAKVISSKKVPPRHIMKIPAEVITPQNAKNFYYPDSVF